jgi:hypothetical protein
MSSHRLAKEILAAGDALMHVASTIEGLDAKEHPEWPTVVHLTTPVVEALFGIARRLEEGSEVLVIDANRVGKVVA